MAGKIKKIEVEGKVITIVDHNSDDFISLTDMKKRQYPRLYLGLGVYAQPQF